MSTTIKKGILLAIVAAALYALSSPLSKLLLDFLPPTIMAGLLYFGAGIGMAVVALLKRKTKNPSEDSKLTKDDLPYTLAMIVLDVAAPIFLLMGLNRTSAAATSLLNNFEIVATALLAFVFFKEKISARLWVGILFVTASCALLSFEDLSSFEFSLGSLFILLATVCWGLENNCTRKISSKDPFQIVIIKGIFSGLGSLAIGFCIGERIDVWWAVAAVLLVGFVAYGLSIFFYVRAQRLLGAARTSAYYAIAPFIGALLSLAIFMQIPNLTFLIALDVMIIGGWLCSNDKPIFGKKK